MKYTTRCLLVILACLLVMALQPAAAQESLNADGIKTYLVERTTTLHTQAQRLHSAAQDYFAQAEAAGFDYETLWTTQRVPVLTALLTARDAWLIASPLYEQAEGIVAGVPALADYDVTLDAGASGAEDPEGGVIFDLTLPDGRVLERPGNLFGVLESTLWGTRADYSSGVAADLNLNSTPDFGELLPDAQVLLAAAEKLETVTGDLLADAQAWTPTTEEAFTALVVMVPTMNEYFAAWRDSRFVAGDAATRTDFVVISRLADIEDILGGLIVVYEGVSPLVASADPDQDVQIRQGLLDLQAYVADLYAQEQAGRVFTAEEADLFGTEAQNRANGIVGQITQVAALLKIPLPEE